MNRTEFKTELTKLVQALIPEIRDDYRASDDASDDTPAMAITIGADEKGWSFQTGDNSFTGGAYGYANWGIGTVYRDSDAAEVAEELIASLEESSDDYNETTFFFDPPRMSCDSCEMLAINGVACHETGCPNSGARWDAESGGWIQQRKCFDCGCTVDADDPCCNGDE